MGAKIIDRSQFALGLAAWRRHAIINARRAAIAPHKSPFSSGISQSLTNSLEWPYLHPVNRIPVDRLRWHGLDDIKAEFLPHAIIFDFARGEHDSNSFFNIDLDWPRADYAAWRKHWFSRFPADRRLSYALILTQGLKRKKRMREHFHLVSLLLIKHTEKHRTSGASQATQKA